AFSLPRSVPRENDQSFDQSSDQFHVLAGQGRFRIHNSAQVHAKNNDGPHESAQGRTGKWKRPKQNARCLLPRGEAVAMSDIVKTDPAATIKRRDFLTGAAGVAAGGAALATPYVAQAQAAVTLKFQSTWPNKDIFHEFAKD